MIEQLLKTPLAQLLLWVFVVFTSLSPGMVGILVYEPELFETQELLKLLVLSAGLSYPFILFNVACAVMALKGSGGFPDHPADAEYLFKAGLWVGTSFSIIPLYTPILIRFGEFQPTTKQALGISFVVEVLVFAIIVFWIPRWSK